MILGVSMNKTGLNFYYNFLISEQPKDFDYYISYLQQPFVRKAIHVGNLTYDAESTVVHDHLNDDMAKSVKPWVEELLDNNYKVKLLDT